MGEFRMETRPEDVLAEKLLTVCIWPLRFILSHPITSKRWQRLLVSGLFSVVSVADYIFIGMHVILYPMDITVLAQIVSSFGLITLAELKVLPLTYYNDLICRMFGYRAHFWRVGNDAALRKLVVELYQEAYWSVRAFNILLLVVVILFLVRPYFDGTMLITLMWHPQGYYEQRVFLAVQTVYAITFAVYLASFNGVFVVSITDLRVQFLILNWRIQYHKYTSGRADLEALRQFVIYHRFLLSIVKDIEKITMIHLLGLYCISIVTSCVELYDASTTEQSLSDQMRRLCFCSALIFQLSMFCLPMADLTNEIWLVSQSFYLSNWEEGSREFRMWLPFAIQATQQEVEFEALGLIAINKMALVEALRKTMSFFTFMRSMK